jgi:ubiquinol-cytochrome c reductase iron-sulfur subunit
MLIDCYAPMALTPAPLGNQYNEESDWSFQAMTKINEPNIERRRILTGVTSFVAGAGLVGAAIPFIQSMNPSARAKAGGAPVTIDPGRIKPGAMITVEWQRKPVWVLRRTLDNWKNLTEESHLAELQDPESKVDHQPVYTTNDYRSIKEELFVAVAVCTHLGCIPKFQPEGRPEMQHALFFCPCHGSKFDLAGRVFKGGPAPTNLIIPPHQYLDNGMLEIGADEQTS